jgi:hypothetical protein
MISAFDMRHHSPVEKLFLIAMSRTKKNRLSKAVSCGAQTAYLAALTM